MSLIFKCSCKLHSVGGWGIGSGFKPQQTNYAQNGRWCNLIYKQWTVNAVCDYSGLL